MQSEIENYKQKLENMSKDQNNKSYQQITIELEANISRLEGELLEYKEVEADLKKTIINFAAETFDLKNQITQFQVFIFYLKIKKWIMLVYVALLIFCKK